MGWLFYDRPPGQSDLEHFKNEWFANSTYTLLDAATVPASGPGYNAVFYAAARDQNGAIGAFIALLSRRGRNFGFKDMAENMGPGEATCPARILDMLSPIEECGYSEQGAEWARQWRQSCRERIAKRQAQPKVSAGNTIQLAQPFTFTDHTTAATFTAVDVRRNRWRRPDGALVKLPGRAHWPDYHVVAASDTAPPPSDP